MIKRAVGLEFDDNAVYFSDISIIASEAFTETSTKMIKINHCGHVNIEPELISNGEIVNFDLLKKSIFPLFKNYRIISPASFIVGISGLKIFIRTFYIPKVPKKEISTFVHCEGENILPYPIVQVFYDYQIIGESETEYQILFSAIDKKQLIKYLELFAKLKVPLYSLTAQPFGLLNLVTFLRYNGGYNGILTRIKDHLFDLIVIYKSKVDLIRTLAFQNSAQSDRVETFLNELTSTLSHFHSIHNLWLNSGLFIGDLQILQAIRSQMPTFQWDYYPLLIKKALQDKVQPNNLQNELFCSIGLGLMGVMKG